jgi:hypothetical protein
VITPAGVIATALVKIEPGTSIVMMRPGLGSSAHAARPDEKKTSTSAIAP